MTEFENYREPGEFGEGATVRRAETAEVKSLRANIEVYKALNGLGTETIEQWKRRADRFEAVLRKIAAYDDAAANAYLRATGSYRCFDEPCAVEMARGVLEGRS